MGLKDNYREVEGQKENVAFLGISICYMHKRKYSYQQLQYILHEWLPWECVSCSSFKIDQAYHILYTISMSQKDMMVKANAFIDVCRNIFEL